ncbi:condensation domain-containing protein, partial [Pelagicoccus sp. SDUM812002]|uniref:condensation domain-containing protein n=1 Tax=Pelagicoccus sp. SDUM812002 TaxID=3041266 RepID=UPI0028100A82
MRNDIAIVGMAGRFPKASNLDELFRNLYNGVDCITSISGERIKDTALQRNRPYREMGYLSDVDKFDYKFFGISKAEAEILDPNQRILMEVCHEAIENGGYGGDRLHDSNTSIFVTDVFPEYYKLADEFTGTMVSGNSPAFIATRLSRQFGFRGNALIVDTSCSSSLVALNLACNELVLKDTNAALVCSSNLIIFPYADIDSEYIKASGDGRSRAFSAHADGMSCGEMAIAILIKRLEDAVADRDNIHAIIKSVAVNNNSNRSASPSAPDSVSQANVIQSAWRKGGINPSDVGYIEAHGSGTQLGDSLEIEGINLAFRDLTKSRRFCALSTVKSAIGHGYNASGLAGLVQAVFALKSKMFPPTQHCQELNPIIDFENSAVYVNRETKHWEAENSKRYAGVTSLGASGTNVHVILQEADEVENDGQFAECEGPYLFNISSHSLGALAKNLHSMHNYVASEQCKSLTDFSYTLNVGRAHYMHRFSVVAENKSVLAQALASGLVEHCNEELKPFGKVIYLLSEPKISLETVERFCSGFSAFESAYNDFALFFQEDNERSRAFRFQYALFKMLSDLGLSTENVLPLGLGVVVKSIIEGTSEMDADLAAHILTGSEVVLNDLENRVKKLINRERSHGFLGFVQVGGTNDLTRLLTNVYENDAFTHCLVDEDQSARASVLSWFSTAYLRGVDVNWERLHSIYSNQLIADLPSSAFDKYRCWLRDMPLTDEARGAGEVASHVEQPVVSEEDASMLECQVAKVFTETLNLAICSKADSFFELGGDSLKATKLINALNKRLQVNLDFEDIYDFATVEALAGFIDSQISMTAKLIQIWELVLKQSDIQESDNFFELGGHSLMANQVLGRIRRDIGISIDFDEFYENPTIALLAACLDSKARGEVTIPGLPPIEPLAEDEDYAVSSSQQRMWVLSQFEGESVAYNTPFAFSVNGYVDCVILQSAFELLIRRHEMLRTVFVENRGFPRQKVLSAEGLSVTIERIVLKEHKRSLDELLREELNSIFDLSKWPLFKVKQYVVEKDRSVLLIHAHHIINDGWSSHLFLEELLGYYRQLVNGESVRCKQLPVQYKDYAAWQNQLLGSTGFEKHRDFWISKLSGELPVLNIPLDYCRPPVKTFNGDRVNFKIDAKTVNKLGFLCQEKRATLFMGLLGLTYSLLVRYSGQSDIIIGTPVAGRSTPEIEEIIGLFVNTIPVRLACAEGMSFSELLDDIREEVYEMYKHDIYPFERMVEDVVVERDLSRSAIFDIMIVLQNTKMLQSGDMLLGTAQLGVFKLSSIASQFDLTFEFIEEGDCLEGVIYFNTDLFKRKTIIALAERFVDITNVLVGHPGHTINELNITTQSERRLLLGSFQGAQKAYIDNTLIHRLFEKQVLNHPDKTAIEFEGDSWTYNELNERANRLAWTLREEHDVGVDQLVALCVDRSVEMLVGILAIMKAGGVYLPIDPDYPDERIHFMLNDAGLKLILVDSDRIHDSMFGGTLLNLTDDTLYHELTENLECDSSPSDLIYCIYTSGSTGRPKGVLIEHRNALNH